MTDVKRFLTRVEDVVPSESLNWRRVAGRTASKEEAEPTTRKRLVVIAIAAVILVLVGVLLWRAFPMRGSVPGGKTSPSAEASDVVRLKCAGVSANLMTNTVQPQSDGLHFEVDYTNPGGAVLISDATLISRAGDGQFTGGFGLRRTPGTRHVSKLWVLAPGRYVIGCANIAEVMGHGPWGQRLDRMAAAGRNLLTVQDPEGLWHSSDLVCGSDRVRVRADGGTLETHPVADVAEHARESIPGIRASDTVEWAGYPDLQAVRRVRGGGRASDTVEWASYLDTKALRVVRGGNVVAWITAAVPDGPLVSWRFEGVACRGSGIGQS